MAESVGVEFARHGFGSQRLVLDEESELLVGALTVNGEIRKVQPLGCMVWDAFCGSFRT